MAESASVALTNDQAEQFVFQLSHEARAVLYRALWNSNIDETMLEELGVEGQTIAQIQAGEKPKVICPHIGCEEMYVPTDLIRIGYHQRGENPYDYAFDQDRKFGWMYAPNRGEDDGSEWCDNAFFCPRCSRPVTLPAKWELYD